MYQPTPAARIEAQPFDRWNICLGFYWAAVMANGTNAAARIWQRLEDIQYSPARSEECIPETMEEAQERGLEGAYSVLLNQL